jgi:hypothetical protein
MKKFISSFFGKIKDVLLFPRHFKAANDDLRFLIGAGQCEAVIRKENYSSLKDLELRVYSQFGDDGIIQYLVHNLDLSNKTFIEFGVENYFESNTRFLLEKDNWSGFVMDGSDKNMAELKKGAFYWKHDLNALAEFVTVENINKLLSEGSKGWDGVDVLHIDIDGNDYWVWKDIEINPSIVIVEYNSNFGIERAITIPYDPGFYRTNAHFSNLYWGCSLKALHCLASNKGYEFIGCNSAGNNAYFIRKDKMNSRVKQVSLEAGYVRSKYRESRDEHSNLTFASTAGVATILTGLPVYDIELGKETSF